MVGDLLDLLGQVADAKALARVDLAAIERHIPHDEAKQRGLAGAVGADKPDPHAGFHMKAGLVEDDLTAKGFRYVGEVEHDEEG